MKNPIQQSFLVLAMVMAITAKAQIDGATRDSIKVKVDTVTKRISSLAQKFDQEHNSETVAGLIRATAYNRFLDDRFTYLTYQRGAFPLGNSAALDFLENSTRLRLGLARKWVDEQQRPSVIGSLGVQAKLGSGIANLFSGDIPSSGMTITGNLSFMRKQFHIKQALTEFMNGKDVPTPHGKRVKKAEKLKNDFRNKNAMILEESLRLLCRLDEIDQELRTLEEGCQRYADLSLERNQIESRLIQSNLIEGTSEGIVDAMKTTYEEAYYKLYAASPIWEWFRIQWFDIGFSYSRSTYITYDGNQFLSERFGTKDFNEFGLKLSFNNYWEPGVVKGIIRSHYANISYEPRITNNYADISDISITKEIQVVTSGDTTFIFPDNKQAKDITNKPFTTSWAHAVSGAYTAMLGEKRNFGLNLFLQAQFSEISKPIYNSRAGVIFSVVNNNYDPTNKESKAKVNFELFLQFPDMNDVSETGKSVWQRSVMGLSTNIPFSKILLN